MRANFRDHRAPCVGWPWIVEMTPRVACITAIVNFNIDVFVAEGEMMGQSSDVDIALDPCF